MLLQGSIKVLLQVCRTGVHKQCTHVYKCPCMCNTRSTHSGTHNSAPIKVPYKYLLWSYCVQMLTYIVAGSGDGTRRISTN